MDKKITTFLEKHELDVQEFKYVNQIFTDPATIMTVAETGYKIYQMFRKKKSKPSAEILYLKKIYAEIQDMQRDLDTIMFLLQDLKVYINQTQIEYIANSLGSKINTVNLFLIEWLESGKGNIEDQFASLHETKVFLGKYGFAHIHLYMIALQIELDLCYWLKRGKNFTQALIDESLKHLNNALNSSYIQDTPAKQLLNINNYMQKLQNDYQPAEFSDEKQYTIPKLNPCGSDGYRLVKHTVKIDGNVIDGFTFTWRDQLLRQQSATSESCRGGGGDGPGGGGRTKGNFSISSTPILNAKVEEYNNAHLQYIESRKDKLVLDATIKSVNNLITMLESW